MKQTPQQPMPPSPDSRLLQVAPSGMFRWRNGYLEEATIVGSTKHWVIIPSVAGTAPDTEPV